MLRRKLLIAFGLLVVLLAGMGVAAVWLLQGVLAGMNHVSVEAAGAVRQADRMTQAVTEVEVELYRLQLGKTRHLDRLIENVNALRGAVETIGRHYVLNEGESRAAHDALRRGLVDFEHHVGALATAQDPVLAKQYNLSASTDAIGLRENIATIDAIARKHAEDEQRDLLRRFRWVLLGMAIGWVLVINVSIMVLLRAAGMVLRPMDQLVLASRHFADERFDYRAHLDRKDEFKELADTYNRLAETVQAGEQRRMEILGQAAVTLNHEVNNALEIIDLQLQAIGRHGSADPRFADRLKQIHESLQRMARTVESLKRIRRIVLTDYTAGLKMLDLEQSLDDPLGGETAERPAPTAERECRE